MMTGGGWLWWVLRAAAAVFGGWAARRWLGGRAFDRGFTAGLDARSRTVRTMIGRDEPAGPRLVRDGPGCTCGDAGGCAVHPYSVLGRVVELSICAQCGRSIFRREEIAGGAWLWNVPPQVPDRDWCPVRPLGGHRPGLVARG